MSDYMNYNNIPQELRDLPQWVCANENKIPINPHTGAAASATEPKTWGTFKEACAFGAKHVGFVLSKDDPYTIIDLDDPTQNSKKEPEANTDLVAMRTARHGKILNMFQSYAELSQSGHGIHIIVKGGIPRGCKRDRVEVYSDSRYMICTGNVYNNQTEITNQQELLNVLFKEMQPVGREEIELVQIDGDESDEDILRMAINAENREKFNYLWNQEFTPSFKYASQSEADFALLSMLCFYTDDNAQVIRLFRQSPLGKRDKAQRDDYINGCLKKIRAEAARAQAAMPKVDFSELLMKSKVVEQQVRIEEREKEEAMIAQAETNPVDFYPPGFVGKLAKCFFNSSFQPMPEASLIGALGLCAGVLGRQFQTSTGSGLALYVCLVAETGYGKEATRTNIFNTLNKLAADDRNLNAAQKANKYIAKEFGSAQSIVKTLYKQSPCLVGVLDEFGKFMSESSGTFQNTKSCIRTAMLSLWGLNTQDGMFAGTAYSDSEKNVEPVICPAVSVVALTTAETLYDVLSPQLIADGFLPRFLLLEYSGQRPNENEERQQMPANMFSHLKNIVDQALNLESLKKFQMVENHPDAKDVLKQYSDYCRTKTGLANTIYNRAAQNARKIAALLAAADNPYAPVVSKAQAIWATQFTERCQKHLLGKFDNHEVGTGNGRQESDLVKAIKDFMLMDASKRLVYMNNRTDGTRMLAETSLIPFCFLLRRARRCNSFNDDKRGADVALKAIIATMMQSGRLEQVDTKDAFAKFGMRSAIYRTSETW